MNRKHAPKGGENEYGRHYNGGEFLPFYVPRVDMPQLGMEQYPLLVRDAFPFGVHFGIADVRELHAHQRVDQRLALNIAAQPKEMLRPVIVSADGYVLDGNHRWWAHVHANEMYLNAIYLHLPFDEAIEWLWTLPYTQHTITPPAPTEPT